MPLQQRPKAHIKIINFYKLGVLQRSIKVDRLLSAISEEEAETLFKEFTQYILNLYKSLILHAIKHQKLPKKYPPLNADYVKFKKRNRMFKGFWQATGFSQVELTSWRVKK